MILREPFDAQPRRAIYPSATAGYSYAALNMIISGVAVYVNSLGVGMFKDAVLYTFMKNAVVGLALAVLFFSRPRSRREIRHLTPAQWALLLVVALIGGSVSYALFFTGLKTTTAVTAALMSHLQFVLVALFAAFFLGERMGKTVWVALSVLFVGLALGLELKAVRWDAGVPLVAASTIFFAADFVLMKYLLRAVSVTTVMTFKMSIGALFLAAYVAVSGHLPLIGELSGVQWMFTVVTGLILLAFTVTSILGLRLASATAVAAIPAGAPIVTTLLVVISRHAAIAPLKWLGLCLALLSVLVVYLVGRRQEGGTRARD